MPHDQQPARAWPATAVGAPVGTDRVAMRVQVAIERAALRHGGLDGQRLGQACSAAARLGQVGSGQVSDAVLGFSIAAGLAILNTLRLHGLHF